MIINCSSFLCIKKIECFSNLSLLFLCIKQQQGLFHLNSSMNKTKQLNLTSVSSCLTFFLSLLLFGELFMLFQSSEVFNYFLKSNKLLFLLWLFVSFSFHLIVFFELEYVASCQSMNQERKIIQKKLALFSVSKPFFPLESKKNY